MIIPVDKVLKTMDKALEIYTPHNDWRYLGRSFRYAMFDERKLYNFREFCVGFSLADSEISRGGVDTYPDAAV